MKTRLLILSAIILISAPIALAFDDTSDHQFKKAIDYLQDQEIVSGYDDGSFKPDNTINRAEFTKIVVGTINRTDLEKHADNCFEDVLSFHWYAKYVCYAKQKEIISGYDDNSFQAINEINIAEASKILSIAYELQKGERREEWYSPYISRLEEVQAIPSTITDLSQKITRAEMSEMIYRLETNKRNLETSDLLPKQGIVIEDEPEETETNTEAEDNIEETQTPEPEEDETEEATQTQNNTECSYLNEDIPNSINLSEIESAWLNWINDERQSRGLNPYTLNPQLSRTAKIWSEVAKDRGYLDHRRNEGDAYYDYNIITDWFRDLGLEFANHGGYTHTENITWGPFTCTSNCTESVINSMETWGFNYFMDEEGEAYSPHFNSIVSPQFKEIGFGLAVDQGNKYYFTIHYGTEITSNPLSFCD